MQVKLFFGINFEFDISSNKPLLDLSCLRVWDKSLKKYFYVFPVSKLNEVIGLTGKAIDFEDERESLSNLIQHTSLLKKEVIVPKYKGEGYLYIQKFPKLFIITFPMRKKPEKKKIPLEMVLACWKSIKKRPVNLAFKSSSLYKDFFNELGITRFNRTDTGTFDNDKLFGTRKIVGYFGFYFSLKVLESEKVISYEKSGVVTRLKDKWEYQGVIY